VEDVGRSLASTLLLEDDLFDDETDSDFESPLRPLGFGRQDKQQSQAGGRGGQMPPHSKPPQYPAEQGWASTTNRPALVTQP